MAHVELSLSGAFVPRRGPRPSRVVSAASTAGRRRWPTADEPCLVIDADTTIVASPPSCCELLGLGEPADAIGQPLLDGVLRLLDFTAGRGELTEAEIEKIPPLLALRSGRLARGLMRVQTGAGDGADATVDAIATPLLRRRPVAGSLTFFSDGLTCRRSVLITARGVAGSAGR